MSWHNSSKLSMTVTNKLTEKRVISIIVLALLVPDRLAPLLWASGNASLHHVGEQNYSPRGWEAKDQKKGQECHCPFLHHDPRDTKFPPRSLPIAPLWIKTVTHGPLRHIYDTNNIKQNICYINICNKVLGYLY